MTNLEEHFEELIVIIQATNRAGGCGCCANYERQDEIYRLITVMDQFDRYGEEDSEEFWKKFEKLRNKYGVLSHEQEMYGDD
jgi:hypothetical protein